MRSFLRFDISVLVAVVLSHPAFGEVPISFSRDIRPILSDHCFACHGPDEKTREADLRLDVAEDAIEKGALAPGDWMSSEVWTRISSPDPEVVMPPTESNKALSEAQKELIRRWIASGANYEQHWSFVSPIQAPIPGAQELHPVDAFLQARLGSVGLHPAPKADRRTLIRRVTLDLTGLPPTPDEVEAFVNDRSEDAYEKLIDGLMVRITHAEQMARYWLDLARYADTHGLHLDNERSLWPYRDWVVNAFHQNLPFDEFTRWQLAGDLLENPTREQLIASGFNRCNVTTSEGGSIPEEWIYRYAVDRTATAAEVWMGLTAGCAVCHDHKFDPLSTRDFYSMYAFFHSAADPAMDGNQIDTPPVLKLYSEAETKQIHDLNAQIAAEQNEINQRLAEFEYIDPALIDPKPELLTQEIVWFEDGFPEGAVVENAGGPLTLVSASEGEVNQGKLALKRSAQGLEQDFFSRGATPFTLPVNAKISVACYLDPEHPPEAIMLQFHSDGWKHRAVWGAEEKIPFGTAKTTDKVLMGDLPEAGKWVLLEVDPAKMGLKAGTKVTGYAFTQFSGTVTWDHLLVHSTVDTTADPGWSFDVWKKQNAGKRNNDLPEGLRQLVRGQQSKDWSKEEDARIFNFWKENFYLGAESLIGEFKTRKAEFEGKKAEVEKGVPITLVMADLPQPRESFVMLRGEYDKPGASVERGVPGFLPALPALNGRDRYNRLDLANWLVDRNHPLTARVTVNRFWQQFFGTGIVRSSADFGSQGDPPSHPELLDWLAVNFMEEGWDVRKFIKLLLTSHAYQQSSLITAELLQRDPENRLLARGPRLRLDAEVLRDQALFVSGLLVDQVGGKAVKPYQPPNIWEPVGFGSSNTRYYQQDTGDALYRRSLYTFLKRTAPPPFMSSFDAPNREQSCTRRERSNTPMQALQLLNDIQHVEAARNFAERMISSGGKSHQERIRWGWQVVLSREPGSLELEIVEAALHEHLNHYEQDSAAAEELIAYGESAPDPELKKSELAAYTMLANLILNLDETVTKN